MNTYTKTLYQFLDLEQIMLKKTGGILNPIINMIWNNGEKILLFAPLEGTTWVEWLVRPPEGIPTEYYRHLILKINLTAAKTLDLVLAERCEGKPDDLDQAFFQEIYRAGNIERYNKTFLARLAEWTDEEEPKPGNYIKYGIVELAWFPLEKGIHAKMVAERIVTEARRIHAEQTAMAKECRK
jgi:hypothetical protein